MAAYEKYYAQTVAEYPEYIDAVKAIPLERFSGQDAIDHVCTILKIADSFHVLNALDHLVTLGELRELTAGQDVFGQHRQYRKEPTCT